jgi:hypothetical protein
MESWQRLAEKIRVGGPLPITFELARDGFLDDVILRAAMETRCIHREAPTRLYNVTRLPRAVMRAEDLEGLFFEAARTMYEHELAEWYTVDGKRIRDPHAPVTMRVEIP